MTLVQEMRVHRHQLSENLKLFYRLSSRLWDGLTVVGPLVGAGDAIALGGLKKPKVKDSTDALSYSRPLVKRSSEQFLFLL